MPAHEPNDGTVLADARDRCRRLLDDLRREEAELRRPPAPVGAAQVGADALAEGRAAYDRAAAAAEVLLRRLTEPTTDGPTGPHEPTDA